MRNRGVEVALLDEFDAEDSLRLLHFRRLPSHHSHLTAQGSALEFEAARRGISDQAIVSDHKQVWSAEQDVGDDSLTNQVVLIARALDAISVSSTLSAVTRFLSRTLLLPCTRDDLRPLCIQHDIKHIGDILDTLSQLLSQTMAPKELSKFRELGAVFRDDTDTHHLYTLLLLELATSVAENKTQAAITTEDSLTTTDDVIQRLSRNVDRLYSLITSLCAEWLAHPARTNWQRYSVIFDLTTIVFVLANLDPRSSFELPSTS
jgi:hypothetical protein